ncbi:hypothetical protein EXIGLDRAFT_718472 [Exidia glandulosa HHB12029]|uniref:Uncharacterized protein n=1 Tax=Exidia glandulosa HHB12029 TaxID=1314781 RepID=A0A165NWU0_EXIGL|nr:hypothetical protein EXIGLDRAFT_718472 [Exidia glandulosa HHB12029]
MAAIKMHARGMDLLGRSLLPRSLNMRVPAVLSLLVAAFVQVAIAQQPSGVPTCSVSCPAEDRAGFAVHGSGTSAGGVLTCSYPAFEGENDGDFFCDYDETTGALADDHDAGLCPPAAGPSTCARRRRANVVQQMAQRRAAAPQSTVPDYVKRFTALNRMKRTWARADDE